ncbi:hypothetical protein T261_8390 [Streptomyces lydicus]|nr:hypothetical protein T261_8390 [Streptomyces lydicus]
MYAKLADIEHYPSWWPAFRSVKQTGEQECEVAIIDAALRADSTAETARAGSRRTCSGGGTRRGHHGQRAMARGRRRWARLHGLLH